MSLAKAIGKAGVAYLNDKHGAEVVQQKDQQWGKLDDDQIEKALNGIFGDPAEGGATVASETATAGQTSDDQDQAFIDMLDQLVTDDNDPESYC